MGLSFLIGLNVWRIDLAPEEHLDNGFDSFQYHLLAKNLAAHHVLSLEESAPFTPNGRRVPLYPAFLGLIYKIFGPDVQIAKLIQTLFGPLICLLVYKIGVLIFANKNAALTAALFTAFSPSFYLMNNHLFVECLFTLMILFSIYASCLWFKSGKLVYCILSGLSIGLCALVKPEAALMAVFVLPVGIFYYPDKKKLMFQSLVAVLMTGAVIVPWCIRNYEVTGKASLINGSGKKGQGLSQLRKYRIRAENMPDMIFRPERFKYLYGSNWKDAQKRWESIRGIKTVNNPEQSDLMFYVSHPVLFMKFSFAKFVALYCPTAWSSVYGLSEDFYTYKKNGQLGHLGAKAFLLLFDVGITLLGWAGLGCILILRKKPLFILCSVPLYFTAIYTLLHGVNRYRIPFVPLMIMMGTWLFFYMAEKWTGKRPADPA